MLKILCIYVVLIPFVVWKSHFEVPKVFVFISLAIILLLYILSRIDKIIISTRDKWYLSWLLWLIVSSFFGESFKISILGGSYRHQGVVFFFCLWLLLKAVELLKVHEKLFLYKIVAITIVIESLIVMAGYKLGTIGEINAVSGFLAIGTYFVVRYLPKWGIIFPVVAMIVDFSKTGLLALLPHFYSKKYAIPIVLAIIVIFALKPINFNSVFENRIVIWKHSVNLISSKPVLGYGAESNEKIFDQAFYESGYPLEGLMIDRAHNLILDITLWSGIVGLIIFCGFLYNSYLELDLDRKKILFSFLIYSMFQPLSVVHWILIALIV